MFGHRKPKNYAETWELINKLIGPDRPKQGLPGTFQTEAEMINYKRQYTNR